MTAGAAEAAAPLTGRATRGAAWLVGARLATKSIDFAMLLVLARLLSPAQFGVIALVIPLVQIAEAVLELPIGSVLVSLDRVERRHTDTAFTLGALRGLILSAVLALAAWPVAAFYRDDTLRLLLPLLGLAPAMRGLISPRMALFARALDYRREFATDLCGKIAALLLATIAAVAFRDYRALVIGTLAAPLVSMLASYVVAPYRPRLSLAAWPAFRRFVGWSTASQLMAAVTWQCDRLALGRFVTPARLGEFSLANDLAYVPEQALIKPIVRPLMSAFAAVKGDITRLRAGYEKAAATILMIGLPMMVGLSVLADPAVRLVLGGKWLRAIPLLQFLPLTLIPALAVSPMPSLAMALGRPEMVWRQLRTEAACRVPLVLAGAWAFGIPGVIAARAAGGVVAGITSLFITRRLLGTPLRRQIGRLARVLAAGGVLAMVLAALAPLLAGVGGVALAIALPLVAGAGMAAYGAALLVTWRLAGRPPGIEAVLMEQLRRIFIRGNTL